MAIAVIKSGGKQYKVQENDIIKVEKLSEKSVKGGSASGGKVEFTDLLNGKKVIATVTSQGKHPKVKIFKFHPKKRYKRTKGHSQQYSVIKIESIK